MKATGDSGKGIFLTFSCQPGKRGLVLVGVAVTAFGLGVMTGGLLATSGTSMIKTGL